ncbi:chromogranin-A [Kryptolebias marmoratus]|uniref:Chromogranin-A n=1 Tax=Kryptolebias marmoratus TaxID=37003 RepID=A0A3Q3B7W0_KRYMA|nr:chromogranin-A [Kryptolebias marmoratus]
MIGRGVFLLTVLSNCVLSLPVTSSQLENDDVEVMKCIVEALADVLSRPHLMPISQECLVTLKTDDRLLTILRHHNFLKELQEIAVQGGHERAVLQRYADTLTPITKALPTMDHDADRSMLDALGGPGERSILSQRKREGHESEEEDESRESQEDSGAEEVEVKRRKEGAGNSKEGGHDEKRANSVENSKEENEAKDKRGDGSDEKSTPSRNKSTKGTFEVEDEEESSKRSGPLSQRHNSKEEEKEEDKMKRGSKENIKHWTKRAKSLQLNKKTAKKEEQQFSSQQEVPHHSKEAPDEDEEEEEKKKRDAQRSPEEKELQMIARGAPEARRGLEDEGSGIRKEEPEIESLAAIESELENVAQKLHDLRRG